MSIPAEHGAEHPADLSDYQFVRLSEYVIKLLSEGKADIYRHVIQEVDRHMLREVMKHCRGNQLQAAERLGISRMTLRSKLRALGMIQSRNQENNGAAPE